MWPVEDDDDIAMFMIAMKMIAFAVCSSRPPIVRMVIHNPTFYREITVESVREKMELNKN
jgi:hypothetical protein